MVEFVIGMMKTMEERKKRRRMVMNLSRLWPMNLSRGLLVLRMALKMM